MKKIIAVLLCFVLIGAFAAGCGDSQQEMQNPVATIKLAGGDVIKLELYPDIAPNTVKNFIYLAEEGFYDGLTFHSVTEQYIQGGDPENNCNGGPGYTILGEFVKNGFDNSLSHTAGTVSMARRSSGYDTAGSQFFIVTEDVTALDGYYAAFGRVIEGMDIVTAISQVETDENGKPVDELEIKKITVETYGTEYGEPEVIKE